jgi:hypothetical protein
MGPDLCGIELAGKRLELFKVRKLRDVTDGKALWQHIMATMRRKTLVLCGECHKLLHRGTLPDSRRLCLFPIPQVAFPWGACQRDLALRCWTAVVCLEIIRCSPVPEGCLVRGTAKDLCTMQVFCIDEEMDDDHR